MGALVVHAPHVHRDYMGKKAELRRYLLEMRRGIPEEIRRRHEGVIVELVRSFKRFTSASTVALYVPVRAEVDILPLLSDRDKRFVFPRTTPEGMIFSPACSASDFTPGAYGIPEPSSAEVVGPGEVDLFLVPGIAFDRYGHRLGYGKGCYDRLIGENPGIVTMGVCMEEFLLHELPVDPWDSRVRFVVTQAGIHKEGEE